MKVHNKKCLICKMEFKTTKHSKRFCSRECVSKYFSLDNLQRRNINNTFIMLS